MGVIIMTTLTLLVTIYLHPPAGKLSRLHQVHSDLEENPEALRDEFHSFLLAVIASWRDKQHREEGSIISAEMEY